MVPSPKVESGSQDMQNLTVARGLDPLPDSFVVMTTESDYALRFSALLTGQPERLGSAVDRNRLAELDLLVLDDHVISAGNQIILRCGPGEIRMTQECRIRIRGTKIDLN